MIMRRADVDFSTLESDIGADPIRSSRAIRIRTVKLKAAASAGWDSVKTWHRPAEKTWRSDDRDTM